MLKHNKIKLSIMVIAITILGTSVLITNPAKTAFGQGTIDDILGHNLFRTFLFLPHNNFYNDYLERMFR